MTAPKPWPPEAREAVARAMAEADGGAPADMVFDGVTWWQQWLPEADAALAALAPWVAQIEAAAFKRGAEAMREANAAVVDAHAAAAKRCSEEGDVIYRIRAEFLANSYAIQSAADDVRVTPIPEDKP